MKKLLSMILVVCVLFSFAFFALGSSSDDEGETTNQGSGAADNGKEDTSSLGDYAVEIKSCRLAKDYEKKPVVIVTYGFTNVNDDDATAFYLAFEDAVYQNGVGLNKAYVLQDSAKYSDENQSKEIKKGATIDVEVAYALNDKTTDIEVEVKELFSFSDKTITKTFSIAE